ncbi:DUF2796 domain-containing protein [Oceanicola sp. S124]|uniref:DUF2796 domain-containing protein n=1 Tax=Oceanicola sp. S124 TaxID=1042378 RepID=UPI0002557959|nr:DUF2796 domain-containing protein [Oceanicola sp. S124]
MKRIALTAMAGLIAPLAHAQEHRELGAHVHGVSKLELAIEDGRLEMMLRSPGADIVGFEHAAESDDDKAAVEAAIARLKEGATLFALPPAAGCSLISASAELESGAHVHDDDHDHHAEEGHDHEDHHDDDHGGHSEFHAAYSFECADTGALTQIGFPFFGAFPNAHEIEAQYVTDSGAGAAEVSAAGAELKLD